MITIYDLSPRRRQVVELIARGRSNKEIAAELGLTVSTVANHAKAALMIVGVKNRHALIAALYTLKPKQRLA